MPYVICDTADPLLTQESSLYCAGAGSLQDGYKEVVDCDDLRPISA